MTAELQSTARLLAVILCTWNEKLRDDLTKGDAVDTSGKVKPGSEWSKLKALTDALQSTDLQKIQGVFSKGSNNADTKLQAVRNLFPTGGGFAIWVAGAPGDPCPSYKTVNAMILGVKASEGVP